MHSSVIFACHSINERFCILTGQFDWPFELLIVTTLLAQGGHLSFQDTGLCRSNRKSITKSREIFEKYLAINPENFLKMAPLNLEMLKKFTKK